MDNYKPELTKVVKELTEDRDRRDEVDEQMRELNDDYEDMIRSREESKKQLEAKLQDVHRKIQAARDYVNAEGKRVRDMLKAFQSKFEYQMQDFKTFMQTTMARESQIRQEMDKKNTARLNTLVETLRLEKENRKQTLENLIGPVREHLESLQLFYDQEKTARIDREKMILQKLDDAVFRLKTILDKEQTERRMTSGALRESTMKDTRTQNKNLEKSQQRAYDVMKDLRAGVTIELDSRLAQQDEISDNLSHFMTTFQDTLKVIATS
jgi:DNA repair exonuclease SbcCD ATPase subunit